MREWGQKYSKLIQNKRISSDESQVYYTSLCLVCLVTYQDTRYVSYGINLSLVFMGTLSQIKMNSNDLSHCEELLNLCTKNTFCITNTSHTSLSEDLSKTKLLCETYCLLDASLFTFTFFAK